MKKWGLVSKLTLTMSLILLVPVLVMSYTYIETYQTQAMGNVHEKLGDSLFQMEEDMVQILDEANNYMNELFYRLEFPYYLDGDNQLTDNEMNYYISNFQSELINGKYIYNNEFSNIGIYSSNQQIDESQYEWQFYIKDLKKKPYYKEVADGDDVQIYGKVRDLDLLSSNLKTNNLNMGNFSNRVLPIYRKVKNLTTGELVGVMEIDVYVSKLINSNSLKESDEEIYHILLDSDRKIVLDTKNASEDLEKMITKSVKSSSGTG